MPSSRLFGIPSNVGTYCCRNMRTFNFGLLAVLSCIAMIGATPVGNDAPVEAIGRRQPMPVPPIPCVATEPEPIPYGCDPDDSPGGGDSIGRRQQSYPCATTFPVPIPFGCDPNYGSGDATEGGDA
ncbi:hypothetical protein DFH94DRAFT_697532 [Russula ochroleuca]|uniref:Uncharacterized protein n=1 Tax=Russula ochroleuca TaxID=152965 RepID=A0A9P5JWT6_9AGAM|nr:hypothetical protein DFH94DRAFT_697532 [Russula ochroleuca]